MKLKVQYGRQIKKQTVEKNPMLEQMKKMHGHKAYS